MFNTRPSILNAVQISKFMKYETALRKKWPQKKPAGEPSHSRGPAVPGEQTPKTFSIHTWYADVASKHRKMPKWPMGSIGWESVLNTNKAEDIRAAMQK